MPQPNAGNESAVDQDATLPGARRTTVTGMQIPPPPHPLNRNPTPGSVNTYRESNAESPSLCRSFPTSIRR